MSDKLVVREKALRQFLVILETQAKRDKESIVQLWQQVAEQKQIPGTC
jgi:hypothetical protein